MRVPKAISVTALAVIAILMSLPVVAYAVDWADDALLNAASMTDLAAFVGIGAVGMVAHYGKKWWRGELSGSLVDYMINDNRSGTLLALSTLIGGGATMWLSGQLAPMPLGPFVLTAFTTGWACDSALNRGGVE